MEQHILSLSHYSYSEKFIGVISPERQGELMKKFTNTLMSIMGWVMGSSLTHLMVLNKDHDTKKEFFKRLRKWSVITFVTSVTWGLLLDIRKESQKTAQAMLAEYFHQHQDNVPHVKLDELDDDEDEVIELSE